MEKGDYYKAYIDSIQRRNYTSEYLQKIKDCIETTCRYCIDSASNKIDNSYKAEHPLMMLGKIQSGKTQAYTGAIALSFDNEFDMVFIMTKNSKALLQQTYKRMRKEFKLFISNNNVEVFDIMQSNYKLTPYELNKKLIVIAKKETHNLDKISNFISDYMINQRKKCIVIDDEADTTGIGFEKIKNSNEFDLRTVAKKINDIRGNLDGCVFVQVTATPYALYLQPEFIDEGDPQPIKPLKTVLVPAGEGYIGGEYYFIAARQDNHPGQFIFDPVSPDEHELVSDQKRNGKKSKINDRRIFKEEEILDRTDKLTVFKRGLMNFIVGGSVLRFNNANTHYAYVIHTATQKSSHLSLESITETFFEQIKNRNKRTNSIVYDMISESYYDIKNSVEAYGYNMPSITIIQNVVLEAIDSGYISFSIINSENDVPGLLDEDTGELRLRSPFSIFIGGQVLDRGITIPNMIGFYYGRNPRNMQQDTVMQHSRMFGYRNNSLLSVTRFYTTSRIYNNMTQITSIDIALREDIEKGRAGEGIYFLQQKKDNYINDEYGSIVPCSPSKILLSNVILLKANARLFPNGFTAKQKIYSSKIVKEVDALLQNIISYGYKDAKRVLLKDIEPIIRLSFSALEPDEDCNRFIDAEKFITYMRYMADKSDYIYLIVRRNREAKKYKERYGRRYLSDAPDTKKDELFIAEQVAINVPALIMLHEKGEGKEWLDREFWWPILVTPQNVHKTIFALPEADGKIRNVAI